MSIKLNSSGGGSVTIQEPTTASAYTLTIPAQTANVITDSSEVLNIGSGQVYKDASGNFLVGTTSLPTSILFSGTPKITANSSICSTDGTNKAFFCGFENGSTIYQGIYFNGGVFRVYGTSGGGSGVYLSNGNTSWSSTSDERLKTDLIPIEGAANKIASIRAVTGRYKTDNEGTSRSFLIAQDVQRVLPEAVNVQGDEQGTLGLQYTDVIPLLVAAIQELKAELDATKAEVAALKGAV
jgi:hypothetical protein